MALLCVDTEDAAAVFRVTSPLLVERQRDLMNVALERSLAGINVPHENGTTRKGLWEEINVWRTLEHKCL